MKRNCEHVAGSGTTDIRTARHRESFGWKYMAGFTHPTKNGGCTVALMNVTVHRHGPHDFLVTLQSADGDRHVMNHAETLPVVGECVMKTAPDIETDPVVQRTSAGQ